MYIDFKQIWWTGFDSRAPTGTPAEYKSVVFSFGRQGEGSEHGRYFIPFASHPMRSEVFASFLAARSDFFLNSITRAG